ncbi:MAG: telomere binding protein [Watsoniomyces obsoletus]|nr:MAG: telomere binding protein [Watsoniomyces obsoletus]
MEENDPQRKKSSISSPEDALQILRSQPDRTTLSKVLQYFDVPVERSNSFNIRRPSPEAALLINTLLGPILSDYWKLLESEALESSSRAVDCLRFLNCLRGINGLGAIEARLRRLLDSAREANVQTKEATIIPVLDLLDVLAHLFSSDGFLRNTWSDLERSASKDAERKLQWRELASLLCSGRLLSVAAEACVFARSLDKEVLGDWLGDGAAYARWLGRNIAAMVLNLQEEEKACWEAPALLFEKSFGLGYTDELVEQIGQSLLVGEASSWSQLQKLLRSISRHQQRQFLHSVLRLLSKRLPTKCNPASNQPSAAAALLAGIVEENNFLKDTLVEWLTGTSSGGSLNVTVSIAAIAALSTDHERVQTILIKSLQNFGDKLYIKHVPMLLQEANTQVVLLSAGCIHRSNSSFLENIARSSIYLQAISNRLGASFPRSRLLGMIVGTAISKLIDPADKRMDFGLDLDNDEVRWYIDLISVSMKIGNPTDLNIFSTQIPPTSSTPTNKKREDLPRRKKPSNTKTGVTPRAKLIQDVSSAQTDLKHGLIPYEKPDSDPEDEDDDPTLVNRSKLSRPVYIRDLITSLRDSDNYERQQLALSTFASLIRRKASFGTEVADHIEELASLLTGLHDKFEMENFDTMRSQGMIALLIAQPVRMGQWYSRAFFDGDYSISQRISILSTLGLGARELAGFKDDDDDEGGVEGGVIGKTNKLNSTTPTEAFPSKLLPGELHRTYHEHFEGHHQQRSTLTPVQNVAKKLERMMIQPLAIEAAESLNDGRDILKVGKVSTKPLEKRRHTKKKEVMMKNDLAKIAAEGFFYPLIGGWWIQLKSS